MTRDEYRTAAAKIDDQYQAELAKLQEWRDSGEVSKGDYWTRRGLVMQAWIEALKALGIALGDEYPDSVDPLVG